MTSTLKGRQQKALGKRLHTDAGMTELMDATFGSDGWIYEAPEDLWVAPDPRYEGKPMMLAEAEELARLVIPGGKKIGHEWAGPGDDGETTQ
jgi:hypothetical protein